MTKQAARRHVGMIIFLIMQFCFGAILEHFVAGRAASETCRFTSSADLKQNSRARFEWDIGIFFFFILF